MGLASINIVMICLNFVCCLIVVCVAGKSLSIDCGSNPFTASCSESSSAKVSRLPMKQISRLLRVRQEEPKIKKPEPRSSQKLQHNIFEIINRKPTQIERQMLQKIRMLQRGRLIVKLI